MFSDETGVYIALLIEVCILVGINLATSIFMIVRWQTYQRQVEETVGPIEEVHQPKNHKITEQSPEEVSGQKLLYLIKKYRRKVVLVIVHGFVLTFNWTFCLIF